LIAPPDWRAVSISRLSTALAATRGPFQEGVLTETDEELAFPSLDAVRRAVKRAYLAGGLGLDDAGGLEPIGRPREGPGGAAWADVRSKLVDLRGTEQRSQAIDRLHAYFHEQGSPYLALRGCLEDLVRTTTPWHDTGRSQRRDHDDRMCLLALTSNLSPEDALEWIGRFVAPPNRLFFRFGWASMPLSRRLRLLFRLPAIGADHRDFPPLRTLGDQLLLTMASRQYFESRKDLDHFIPLLAAAVILVGGANPTGSPAHSIDVDLVVRPALAWLVDGLLEPATSTESEAEAIIEKLVNDIAWLKLRPKTDTDTHVNQRSQHRGPAFSTDHDETTDDTDTQQTIDRDDLLEEYENRLRQQRAKSSDLHVEQEPPRTQSLRYNSS
jgi:hypothetical protein